MSIDMDVFPAFDLNHFRIIIPMTRSQFLMASRILCTRS
jgi:hypothetical protein